MTELLTTLTSLDIQGIINTGLLALGAFVAFMTALYAFLLKIPGDQPDKAVKAFLEFTKRLSAK